MDKDMLYLLSTVKSCCEIHRSHMGWFYHNRVLVSWHKYIKEQLAVLLGLLIQKVRETFRLSGSDAVT